LTIPPFHTDIDTIYYITITGSVENFG